MLGARVRDLVEQLQELRSLRGKNQGVIAHMMRRVEMEKKEFDASLFKLQGTRAVFTTPVDGAVSRRSAWTSCRKTSTPCATRCRPARFATGMRAPVRVLLRPGARQASTQADAKIGEIGAMMESMYSKFSAEHGLALTLPMTLSLERYRAEIDAIEAIYQKQFGTTTLLMTSRGTLLERFFDSIASRVRRSVPRRQRRRRSLAEGDHGAAGSADPPAHATSCKHRQASIQRIHDATDSLEQKIAAFETAQQRPGAGARRSWPSWPAPSTTALERRTGRVLDAAA